MALGRNLRPLCDRFAERAPAAGVPSRRYSVKGVPSAERVAEFNPLHVNAYITHL